MERETVCKVCNHCFKTKMNWFNQISFDNWHFIKVYFHFATKHKENAWMQIILNITLLVITILIDIIIGTLKTITLPIHKLHEIL